MPRRLLLPLLLTLAGVQSHWLDDIASGAPDGAGVTVSAVASAFLVAGWLAWPKRAGFYVLRAGWIFTVWVSAADLAGLGADGSLAGSPSRHWAEVLGWPVTVAVTVTLLAALAGLAAAGRARPD